MFYSKSFVNDFDKCVLKQFKLEFLGHRKFITDFKSVLLWQQNLILYTFAIEEGFSKSGRIFGPFLISSSLSISPSNVLCTKNFTKAKSIQKMAGIKA